MRFVKLWEIIKHLPQIQFHQRKSNYSNKSYEGAQWKQCSNIPWISQKQIIWLSHQNQHQLFSHAPCTYKNAKRCTKLTHPAPFGIEIQHQTTLIVFTRMQDEVFAWIWCLNMQSHLKFINEVPNQSRWTRICRFKPRPALPNCHVKTTDRTEYDGKWTYTIPFFLCLNF